MAKQNSDKLPIGDIISFISIVFLGIVAFFGMNFMTLGNKIPSVIVAVLLTVLMTVFVFFAAFAKSQNRNQENWSKVKLAMIGLYLVALIPCYIFSAKFCEIQFGQDEIVKKVDANVSAINKMFDSYAKNCDARANAYGYQLKAYSSSQEGKSKLVSMLGLKSVEDVNQTAINQATESFLYKLKGNDYQALEAEKDALVQGCTENFNNWNIMSVSQYASDLGNVQEKFSNELQNLYEKSKNTTEKDIPEFNAAQFAIDSNIAEIFKSFPGFSLGGLLIMLMLGFLGMVKFITAPNPTVKPIAAGDSSSITGTGGFIIH